LAATTITCYQSSPTTAEIEHSCSFSVVVGFPWLPPPRPPINHPLQLLKSSSHAHFGGCGLSRCHYNPSTPYSCRTQAFVLVFSCCRLPLATTTTPRYQSHNRRNRALMLIFGGCGLSGCHRHDSPSTSPLQPPKSSICARFRRLWAFSGCRHQDRLSLPVCIPPRCRTAKSSTFCCSVIVFRYYQCT